MSSILDPAGMRARKERFFRFVREQAPLFFNPDGSYRETTENDRRITFWMFPALVASDDPAEREWALRFYAADPCWSGWNIFTTSSIAGNLVREHERLSPELIRRSEEHLAKFVVVDGGRKPSSGANDYIFHGYNDNMPAMAVRAMIFAGDVLGRADLTDQGLFYLEGLCAHFARRGWLSEHTSATYTSITLTSLLDVAECSTNAEAREMAQACANRVLLDVLGHWHPGTGMLGGPQSRAYTVDAAATLSIYNALMWYLSGSPMCMNLIETLAPGGFNGPIHHGGNRAFNIANGVEVFSPSYAGVDSRILEFARAARPDVYEIRGTTDSGQSGLLGGVQDVQTRAYHRPLWWLGSASRTWFDQSGHQLVLDGGLACKAKPESWRDRVTFWHHLQEGTLEQGDLEPAPGGGMAQADLIKDHGHYHVLQNGGSALVLGVIGPGMLDQTVEQMKLVILFGAFRNLPDEMYENETPLAAWDGTAMPKSWQLLRYGDVYAGIRATGMVDGVASPVRRRLHNGYLRVEVPIIEGKSVRIDQEFREWADFGYVFEIADKDECGSFEAFRRQCQAATWEFFHAFYRNSRYCGRNGELQIIDSVAAGSVRFMAINGKVEPQTVLSATGLDPELTNLFPGGRRIQQRRISYRPHYVGSPFYEHKTHILETDIPGVED